MTDYSSRAYWDERYRGEQEPYDFYVDARELVRVLSSTVLATQPFDAEILIPGCGSSELHIELLKLGYRYITMIDWSDEAVRKANSTISVSDVEAVRMDVSSMCSSGEVPENAFDLILSKGLLDSILCGEDGVALVRKTIDQCAKALKPTGVAVFVSHGVPSSRTAYLKQSFVDVQWMGLPKPLVENLDLGRAKEVFAYVCRG